MKLAHVGIAVRDLAAARDMFTQILGAKVVSAAVEDPAQEAVLQMLLCGDTYVELIAPAGEHSNVETALKAKGEGPLHLCYETADLDETLGQIRRQGAMVFRPATDAVLFGGKRVAFAMMPNRMIVEFVEEGWEQGMPQ